VGVRGDNKVDGNTILVPLEYDPVSDISENEGTEGGDEDEE
jgi:hypothetical protein